MGKGWERVNDYLIRVPRQGAMEVEALIFARPEIPLEDSAIAQLREAASLPTVTHALGMPDLHQGFGVPIGSVAATREIIVPAAVGYDVNCGMRLLPTSLRMSEADPKALAEDIRRLIPLGEGKKNVSLGRDDFVAILEGGLSALDSIKKSGHRVWEEFEAGSEIIRRERVEDQGSLEGRVEAVPARAIERGREQLATLGGGNHFIELQEVEQILDPEAAAKWGLFEGQFAIMIHSGSRGFGHEVGGHYMKLARKSGERSGEGRPGLGFFPAADKPGRDYLAAMNAAANFAFVNRALMGALAGSAVKRRHPGARLWLLYDVPHNIAKLELHEGKQLWVHRKGGTRAFDQRRMQGTPFADIGQPALIPGSMGTASYVLVGQASGAASLFSVNHGAGRLMSRTQAAGGRKGRRQKRTAAVSDQEFKDSMEGIHLICEDRRAVKEEAPAAYKDIDQVIETVKQAGLARPVARLRPRAVLKG